MEFRTDPLEIARRYRPNQRKFPDHEIENYRDGDAGRTDLSELYHENTKIHGHTEQEAKISVEFFNRRDSLQEFRLDQPTIDCAETVDLPDPASDGIGLYDALGRRESVREFDGEPLSKQQLSDLLVRSAGVTRTNDAEVGGAPREERFRAYPSPGALYPVDLYLVLARGEDVSPGVYYFENETNELRVLDEMTERRASDVLEEVTLDVDEESEQAAVGFLVGDFPRAKVKYGDRGYRYVLQESGHLCQNLLLVATALGLGAYPSAGFYDDRVDDLLRIDGRTRATLYSVHFGGVAR